MAWWFRKNYSYAGPRFSWLGEAEDPSRGVQAGGLSCNRPPSARNVPKAARYRERYSKPPSPDVFFVDGAVVVKVRFRELVEQFEPGVHLFVPIELQFHDGRPMPGEYYFFNTRVDIDCVLTDNRPEWFHIGEDGRISSKFSLIGEGTPIEILLSKPPTEGRHLWTGGPLAWGQLFASDTICAAFRKGRFRVADIHRYCPEIDRPWVAEENMGPLLGLWRTYVAHNRNIYAEFA